VGIITPPLILNLSTNGDEKSASRSGRFTSWKSPWYPLNRRVEFYTNLSCLCRETNPGSSSPQPGYYNERINRDLTLTYKLYKINSMDGSDLYCDRLTEYF